MAFKHKRKLNYILFPLVLVIGIFLLGFTLSNKTIYSEPCNGHVELCSKKVNEIAYATSHNAMSFENNDWFAPSHGNSIPEQLDAGIRAFMIDTHYFDAVSSISSYYPDANKVELILIQRFIDKVGKDTVKEGTFLCHLICQLGSTPLDDSLSEVKEYLDENPREVVFLILEDRINKEDTVKAVEENGIFSYVYTHDGNEWPTLGKLIDDNKRVIIMSEFEGAPPAWLNHAWDYTEETPYAFKSVEEMNCSPNRGDTGKDFLLVNHWIERAIPRVTDAIKVNQYDILLKRAKQCANERGFNTPNFVAVNFSSIGDVIEVVNTLNGVSNN